MAKTISTKQKSKKSKLKLVKTQNLPIHSPITTHKNAGKRMAGFWLIAAMILTILLKEAASE